MARRGSGFGMVMLVITLLAVLLLVARSWRSVAPGATRIPDRTLVRSSGDGKSDDDPTAGLPDLRDAQRETDAHAQQVQDAMAGID